MDADDILTIEKIVQSSRKEMKDDMKQLIEAQNKLFSMEIGAAVDVLKPRIECVEKNNDAMDQRLKTVEKEIIGPWFRKHWRLALTLGIIFFFIYT